MIGPLDWEKPRPKYYLYPIFHLFYVYHVVETLFLEFFMILLHAQLNNISNP